MFWRSPGLVQTSPVELVLDKDSFTLEDLLEEDDVIQECKSLNSRLVNFLKTRPVVEKLVAYMVQVPGEDADAKREFKYPYLACEIFCCEIDAVFSTLVENDCALFGKILGFVDQDAPLNSMLACYFSKTVGCLLARRQTECMAFLQRQPQYLDRLVDHVRVLAVAEVLLRLVGADDPGVMSMQGMMLHAVHGGDGSAWLADTPLLDRLLDALGSSSAGSQDGGGGGVGGGSSRGDATQHANAAEVLVGIARCAPSALAAKLAGKDSMRKLFLRGLGGALSRYGEGVPGGGGSVNAPGLEPGGGCAVTAHDGASSSPLVNVLDIAIAVIDAKRAAGSTQSMQAFLQMECSEPPTARAAPLEALEGCLEFLPALVAFLEVEGDGAMMHATWGTMAPPLGLKRVKVVDLLATLLSSHHDTVAAAVLECGALPVCCRLFAQYPFNNFLHHHVESMMTSVLEWGHPQLVAHLLTRTEHGGCDVIGVVTGAAQTVATVRGPMRAGNLGHVTRLGNKLVSLAAGNFDAAQAGCDEAAAAATAAALAAALAADARWGAHVEGNLKERNAVENVYKWSCGRPAGLDDKGGGVESDNDEDMMTRDFDIGLGGGFSRDVYHRYGGGLGDEDDDDDDDDDDDEEEEELDALNGGTGGGGLFQGDAGARLASLTLKEDYDSDEEDDAAAVAPFRGALDDDEVILVDSDDDDSDSDDDDDVLGVGVGLGGSPTAKSPTQLLRGHARPGTARVSPTAPRAAQEEEKAEYNSYNFWSSGINASLVPDDI